MESAILKYNNHMPPMIDDVVLWMEKLWVVDAVDIFGFLHLWRPDGFRTVGGAPVVDIRHVRVVIPVPSV